MGHTHGKPDRRTHGPLHPKFLRGMILQKDWPQKNVARVFIPYFVSDKQLAQEIGFAMRRVLAGEHLPKNLLPGHIPPPDDPGLCECDGRTGENKCSRRILEWAWRRYCAAYPEEVF